MRTTIRGYSWGLEYPYNYGKDFQWNKGKESPCWVVYNYHTGLVADVFWCTEACLKYCFHEHEASKKSLELNGNPGVDTAGIDSTP